MPYIKIMGIDCHIGSQITELEPFIEALHRIIEIVDTLATMHITLSHIDLGGGIGVRYQDETTIDIEEYASAIQQSMGHRKHTLFFEPGRYIVANAGILLSRVVHLKENEGTHFAILDTGMNDLIRPALYQSWQGVTVVKTTSTSKVSYNLVGPICESGDFIAHDRTLCVNAGDYIAIHSAGAYGFAMSSNYNSRNRAAELIVSDETVQCVRKRESIEDQLNLETIYKD
jgi:diaminopimelate decarboxylase